MAVELGVNAGFVTVAPTADPESGSRACDNAANGNKYIAPATGIVTEMGWYCGFPTEAANYELGVYNHDAVDDEPEDDIGSDRNNAKGTTAGWKIVTGLNIPITKGVIYWLCMQLDNTATTSGIDDEDSLPDARSTTHPGATTMPDPWGDGQYNYQRTFAIYAVYTAEEPPNTYPVSRLRKDFIHGYNCFVSAYVLAKLGEFDPLKLPDGTAF